MATRYPFDPPRSRFTVQAFATGLLSSLGHSPTFEVGQFSGDIQFGGGEVKDLALALTIQASSLSLVDRVSASDRLEIETRMQRDVLESSSYPEITYRASVLSETRLGPGHFQLQIVGPLSLHGESRNHTIDVELTVLQDGLFLKGETPLRLSDHRIKPVSALGGAIKLKDELRVAFDIGAHLEQS
jgi:polyisoprenoid-binding protein YceI